MQTATFSPRALLMDFYAVTGVQFEYIDPEDAALVFAQDAVALRRVVVDGDTAEEFQALRSSVIKAMQETLLRDVLFVLAAEVRHIYDQGTLKPSKSAWFAKHFGPVGSKWYFVYDAIYAHGGAGLDCPLVAPEPPLDAQFPGYLQSYVAGMTESRETGLSFAEVAEKVFDKSSGVSWASKYGGSAWLEIARAYLDLQGARTEEQVVLAADRIISLEHNTATLFTKCSHWALCGAHDWIRDVLDIKFSASSPLAFLGLCSKVIQDLILRVEASRALCAPPGSDLRLSQAPEEGETPKEPSPAAERDEIVASVGVGDSLGLLYEGAERKFIVHGVQVLSDTLRCFTLAADGWGDHKGIGPGGRPLMIGVFAMTGQEVADALVSHTPAGVVEKARHALAKLAADLHAFLEGVIALDNPLLALGSLQIGPSSLRFRIKGPDGGNFRVYVALRLDYKIEIRYGTSRHPADEPSGETLVVEITQAEATDPDRLPELGRKILGLAKQVLAGGDHGGP